ncbi:RNA polymerase II mediator complex subunit [Pichia californica]|uniref:Mediator of RNA polymerase II transcription subunit 21 n=1 Tax=Pichia californica TaxID=460514 RepID=A0A9P7BDW7_9ASCO|nr:RNA polymerase II mediator complex subunit [[Candida] californica]KAG0687286.1 RNA polymerase II mediator complex subunit [[Candida] californica]
MTDRLTQLQLCLDQLTDILFSALSYIDQNHDSVPLNESDPKETDTGHNPVTDYEFHSSQQELSTDIILKTRQILTIIDTLPGIGTTKTQQMETIQNLRIELNKAEQERKDTILEKEKLLDFVNDLILKVGDTISATR